MAYFRFNEAAASTSVSSVANPISMASDALNQVSSSMSLLISSDSLPIAFA